MDLIQEVRGQATLQEALIKRRTTTCFNQVVIPRTSDVEDLILRRTDAGLRNVGQGKLDPNWEGPYRVIAKTSNSGYRPETMGKEPIPRTWNTPNLKYFS